MDKPRVTIADVAELAQVSKMSVSRVLNGQGGVSTSTRQRILDAVQQLGYIPGPGLRSRPSWSKLVALLVPDITTTYMGEILRGVSGAAERLNYGLMLYTQGSVASTDHTRRTSYYLSLLNNTLVDGVLMAVPLDYEVIVNDLKAHNLIYVIIDHHSGAENEPSVTATNRRGALEAMRHLFALGHRRIGFITGRMDIACSHDRLQGYREGLAEIGLPFDPELVREGDFTQPTGFQQAQVLLQLQDRLTAIFASNDVMAFGVMDAVKAAGLTIGQDISIVGFDDIAMATHTYPPLTTVRQPLAAMGETALELLVTLLEGRTALTMRRELPTELVIRESTGLASKR
ncbi:MAG TPA: LacI family DNA-binding transcriptional regulator [Aggregatilineales bacterium]|nr:LacI family DNA-binding transcriptional regulator [Aggregatilineales bacterium]